MSTYADVVFDLLEKVRERKPYLIELEADLRSDYGLGRSARRGLTTQARLQGVSEADINTQCGWRSEENVRGREIHRSMFDLYAEMSEMEAVLLRPSKAL